jgi:hypothetical protein
MVASAADAVPANMRAARRKTMKSLCPYIDLALLLIGTEMDHTR